MSYIKRIENVQNYLISQGIDFLIIKDSTVLFYLTSLHLSRGLIIIGQTTSRLFVDGRYIEAAKKKSSFSAFLYTDENISDFFLVKSSLQNMKIVFDSDRLTYREYEKTSLFLDNLKQRANRSIEFNLCPMPSPLKNIRSIKTNDEISYLRGAAAINWRGFEYITTLLKEGVTELFLANEYERYCKKTLGATALAFDPLISFGKNTSMPHHKSSETTLKNGDIVLIDIGIVSGNYHSDMTRCLFFGEGDAKLMEIYSIVKAAQKKALSLCRPGVLIGDIDKAARDYISDKGYGDKFIHALGHGIGLETHEFPSIKYDGEDKDTSLSPGMVITIEPGIYLEGLGGVRYEDTILITREGYDNFYAAG